MTEQQWPKGWGKGAGVTHDVLKHQKGDPVNVEPGVRVFVEDTDLTLYQGDVLEVLKTLPAESVHCVVTSPPYWGLRDYGTGSWVGGNPDCDHLKDPNGGNRRGAMLAAYVRSDSGKPTGGAQKMRSEAGEVFHETCGKCGARRVDNQLGLEPTPDQYVENMVGVFREVRRVLRVDGTCWVNMGDSYASNWPCNRRNIVGEGSLPNGKREARPPRMGGEPSCPNCGGRDWVYIDPYGKPMTHPICAHCAIRKPGGLKEKDLCMIPARLALALQADGWWLRSQIVWSKPNPMPESVTDRPTASHEFVYLLTKSPRYFFDQEAVREPQPSADPDHPAYRPSVMTENGADSATGGYKPGLEGRWNSDRKILNPAGRNIRSVWQIATQPYPEAHFATYPEELVRRCILAGSSERGCCAECGAPWERLTNVGYEKSPVHGAGSVVGRHEETGANNYDGAGMPRLNKVTETLGWGATCSCDLPLEVAKPCTVLDPFFGSGTTGLVARKHGRRTIGIELNPSYCELAARRLQQLSLLA